MLEIENPAGAAARTARSLRNHVSDDFTMTIRATLVFAILFACQAAHADCSCECINGRMQPLCPNLDVVAVCPETFCPLGPPSIAPFAVPRIPPFGSSLCRQARVCDPSGNCQLQTVCN
jgi:hypothetical protein